MKKFLNAYTTLILVMLVGMASNLHHSATLYQDVFNTNLIFAYVVNIGLDGAIILFTWYARGRTAAFYAVAIFMIMVLGSEWFTNQFPAFRDAASVILFGIMFGLSIYIFTDIVIQKAKVDEAHADKIAREAAQAEQVAEAERKQKEAEELAAKYAEDLSEARSTLTAYQSELTALKETHSADIQKRTCSKCGTQFKSQQAAAAHSKSCQGKEAYINGHTHADTNAGAPI